MDYLFVYLIKQKLKRAQNIVYKYYIFNIVDPQTLTRYEKFPKYELLSLTILLHDRFIILSSVYTSCRQPIIRYCLPCFNC